MPTRRKGEKKQDYISRAIRMLIKEGRPQKQAVAIAHDMWRRSLRKLAKEKK